MNLNLFKRIVSDYAGVDSISEISMDMTFSYDLILNDETYYELIEALENEFNVDIMSYDGDFDALSELAHIIRQG
jgi:acyl carrier protein